MGGQVLGGGVIVLVAVVLWLVYLLPSWHSRHQYDAAERNAVRLNQALRVLAETSETPREVHLELNARTAHAQQRLARSIQVERESARLEVARAELAVMRADPLARRARARRRARAIVAVLAAGAAGVGVWGGIEVVRSGSQVLLWYAVAAFVGCAAVLHRMNATGRRAAARVVVETSDTLETTPVAVGASFVPEEMFAARGWTPRQLPRPLASSAGSRAAAELDTAAAHAELDRAVREESIRERAAAAAPPSIAAARAARNEPDFAAMGRVDDAALEAHVRELLARRAAG